MARDLPTLDDILPGFSARGNFANYVAPTPKVEVQAAPTHPYDLLTPEQKAQVDLLLQPRSAMGEIGAGALRGLTYELPKMLGQALQSTGQQGDTLYDTGSAIRNATEGNNLRFAEDLNPDAHNVVTQAVAQGAAMLAPSVAPMVAGLALAPFTGGTSAMAAAGGLGAGLFGASQYQDTYDKAIKAGKTPEEAHSLGLQTGAIEGLGESVGTFAGARFLKGAGEIIPRVLGRKYGTDEALAGLRNPQFLKTFAKELGETAAVETGTEMGQNYGEAAVEKNAGIDTQDPWQAATAAIGPTIALTGILAPFGGLALRRQQTRNKLLVDTVESPNSTLPAVGEAAAQLVPQLEPLVGKEEAQTWRLDALAGANERAAGAWDVQQRNDLQQQVGEQRADEMNQQLADAANAPAPVAPVDQSKLPVPGVAPSAPHYPGGVIEADMVWQRLLAQRDAEQNETKRTQLTDQLVANPPQGAVPFSEWVKQSTPTSSLGLENTRRTAAGLKQGYLDYLRTIQEEPTSAPQPQGEQLRLPGALGSQLEIPSVEEQPFTLEPSGTERALPAQVESGLSLPTDYADAAATGQGALDLKQDRSGAVAPTALELAFERAQQRREGETKQEAFQRAQSEAEAARQVDIEKLARIAQGEREAQRAIDGGINGNTPIRGDLMPHWEQAAKEAGIDISTFNKQNRGRIQQALNTARGKQLWVQQLNALRKARDSMTKGTALRDSMSAFVTKLENFNGVHRESSSQSASGADEKGRSNGEGSTQAGQDAVRQSNAVRQEVTDAAATGQQQGGGVAEHQDGDRRRSAAETGSSNRPVERPTRPTEAAKKVGLLNADAAVEPARSAPPPARSAEAAASAPVAYGDVSNAHAGEVDYTAPVNRVRDIVQGFKQSLAKLVNRPQPSKLVPEADKRKATEENQFAFEHYHYDTNAPQREANNLSYIADFAQAKEEAAGKKSQVQQNAQKALDWLKSYDPENYALADGRVQRLQAAVALSERMGTIAREAQQQIDKNLREWLTDTKEREDAERRLKDFINLHLEAETLPVERPVEHPVIAAMRTGEMRSVLAQLAANGPTEWSREVASFLWASGLSSKVNYTEESRVSENGGRIRGSYHAGSDTVIINHGGTNTHTVLHEATHAATIQKLFRAMEARKIPPSRRTLEEHALVTDLSTLSGLMHELEGRDHGNPYAFTNELEFVAEVWSNEKFQRWLAGQTVHGRSALQRLWNWVTNFLGAFDANTRNALVQAMSLTQPFFDSKYAKYTGMSVDHAPAGALSATDNVTTVLRAKYDQLLNNSAALGNAGSKLNKTMLAMFTTHHIQQWIAKSPSLQRLVPSMNAFKAADAEKTLLLNQITERMAAVNKRVELSLANLPIKDQTAMVNRMGRLQGEQSRLGLNLNKNFDQNRAENQKLDPALRDYVNQLHNEYRQLPAELRGAMEDAVRELRRTHIQRSAVTAQNVLRSVLREQGMASTVQPWIDRLNVRNPALDQASTYNKAFFADSYSANLDAALRSVLKDVASSQQGTHLLRDIMEEVGKVYTASVGNPYHHLGRYGEHFIDFKLAERPDALAKAQAILEPYGKVVGPGGSHVFMRFENKGQRDTALRALLASGVLDEANTKAGSLYEKGAAERVAGVPGFVRHLLHNVDEAFPGDVYNDVRSYLKKELLDYLPDASPQKAMAQRKGTPGYEASFLRNFNVRAAGAASAVANGHTMPKFDDAFQTMRDETETLRGDLTNPTAAGEASQIADELGRRFGNSLTPVDSPVIDKFKAFGYNFYLALSPAFWITNVMQPWQLSLPVLGGRYGFVKSAKEMGRATSKALRIIEQTLKQGAQEGAKAGGAQGALVGILDMKLALDSAKLSEGEKAFVMRLLEAGQLDVTQGKQYGHLADNSSRAASTAAKFLSIGSHYTEVLNRLTAGLAAYNLEMARGNDSTRAVERGIQTVMDTQFDYSDRNTGRAFGRHGVAGKVTPLLASFQNYAFQSLELLLRLVRDATLGKETSEGDRAIARKALVGLLGTTSVLAGTLGLPLANVIARLMDAFGDPDDPTDVKTAYRQWLASWLGNDVAEAVARGVPRAVLGFDTSGRAGLQDLLPGSRFITDRRQLKDQIQGGAFNLLGPAVSAATDVTVGMGHMLDGQVAQGLTEFLPMALRGPAKAAQMAQNGYVNSVGMKLPMEVTPWSEFVQAMGFTPSVKAEQQEANAAFRQHDMLLKQQKGQLSNELYRTIEQGGDATQIMSRVQQFNSKNPQYRISPAGALQRRAKEQAVADFSGADIATLPRYLPLLERYSFANVK